MTKEELEKESKEKFEQYKLKDEDYVEYDGEKMLMFNREYYAEDEYFRFYFNGYLAGAKPREKQIEIDAKQIRALQKQNGELTDRVKELEAQIEEMKCLNEVIIKALNECKEIKENDSVRKN